MSINDAIGPAILGSGASVAAADITDAGATGIALVQAATAAAARATLSLPASVASPSTSGRLVGLFADDLAINDGDAVASWSDGVRAAVQATLGARPTFRSGASGEGIGGRAVVRFDGTDDRLTIAGDVALDVTTLTVYVVWRARRDSADAIGTGVVFQRPENLAGSSPYSEWHAYLIDATTVETRVDGGTFGNATLGAWPHDAGTPHIHVLTVGAGGTSTHVDGRRLTSLATTAITYGTAGLQLALGASAYTTPTDFLRGDIACFQLFSGAHTAAQRRAWEGYLSQRYSIPIGSGET